MLFLLPRWLLWLHSLLSGRFLQFPNQIITLLPFPWKIFLNIFDHEQDISGAISKSRLLESVNEESKYNLLNAGETGEDSITSIPFQVLDFIYIYIVELDWNLICLICAAFYAFKL
jgi:hypothetical protein